MRFIQIPPIKNPGYQPLPVLLVLACIILALFAFTSHLGYLPVDSPSDEARRGLVSLEMMLSHNYLTPTINQELYFLKPPLYNWLIILSFKIWGFTGFGLRFPMLVSLLVFGWLIFYFVRKFTADRLLAFLCAFAFLTNGRMLFYDSLQGLIDTSYSMLMYTCFMLVYQFGLNKQWKLLFTIAYFLTAICFLMKGWPAIAALSISLLTYFIYTKQVRQLFGRAHLAGIAIFLLVTGLYYFLYFRANHLAPDVLLNSLLDESVKRTALKFSLKESVLHFILFPFQFCYHFAPWTILLLMLFHKKAWLFIKGNPFILFNAWIFITNVVVYWSSPQEYPRYLFFVMPLLFTVLVYVLLQYRKEGSSWYTFFRLIFLSLIVIAWLLTGSNWLFDFLPTTTTGSRWAFLFVALSVLLYLFYVQPGREMIVFILFLLVSRIGFNWLVIEHRGEKAKYTLEKSREIAAITAGSPLYWRGYAGNTDTWSFQLSAIKKSIITVNDSALRNDAFYLVEKTQLGTDSLRIYSTIAIPFANDSIVLVKQQEPVIR